MARYNDEPAAGGEGTEEIQGYREGVEAVISWIKREGLACTHDIRSAIDRGEI